MKNKLFTIGVEEEYMICDTQSYELIDKADQIMSCLYDDEKNRYSYELLLSEIESNTSICNDTKEAISEIIKHRNRLREIGTAIYEPIDKEVVNNVSGHHFSSNSTKKYFKKVKTCPFCPNSVLIFPVTKYSYHGVEEINIEQRERNLLLLNYFFKITP